jgi:hypothetical protein
VTVYSSVVVVVRLHESWLIFPPFFIEQNSHKRVPLIKFLGKRSLLKKSDHSTTVESTNTTATAEYGHELSPVASLYDNYDAAGLGRPALTDEEIEAVETGGASLFG